MSLLLPYTLVSMVLDFSQMVLVTCKHLLMVNIIILNNSYYCNFSKKSISDDVQVQILKEPVDASHAEKTLGLWVIPQDSPRRVVSNKDFCLKFSNSSSPIM